MLQVDAGAVDALNAIDPAITLATLPQWARVAPRQMLATIKIIPYATPGARVAEAEIQALLGALRPLLVGGIDEAALYACNLVSGVVHSLSSEYRPDAAATAPE